MINIDMWYDHKPEEVTGIDWSFSDLDCVYTLEIVKRTQCRKYKNHFRT